MSNNITYLFGAGASYKAVPMVKEIPKEIDNFIRAIKKTNKDADLLEALIWVKKESSKFGSIDDFALSLYNYNEKEFRKFKATMCCFFTYVQLKNNVNPRYHAFLHRIKNKIDSQISNVKILSWNYDFQFERAYHQSFENKEGLDSIQRKLNVIPSNSHENKYFNSDKFVICKLNGTALAFDKRGPITGLIDDLSGDAGDDNIKILCDEYTKLVEGVCIPLLRFAFESEYEMYTNRLYEGAAKATLDAIQSTNILVIIGYSFPHYNRVKDTEIFGAMRNLKRVVIQAPRKDVANYVQRFKVLLENNRSANMTIEPWSDIDMFFIPQEIE